MRIKRMSVSMAGLLDGASLAVIIFGTAALLVIDISSPRGVIDGIAYPGIVALTARFGKRATLACAVATSVLILIGSLLSPDYGISVGAEIANRFFALLSVWVVTLVLNQRFQLERDIAAREDVLASHQQALLETVHQVLLVDQPLPDRIRRLTEIAAKSLDVGRVGVFRWREDATVLECLDMYRHPEDIHEIVPDLRENRHPDYLDTMRRELIVAADDVRYAPFMGMRQDLVAQNNVGAVVGAGIFLDGKLSGQITFSHLDTPRHWSMQELAYCRSLANVMSILFSATRNSETLAALDLVSEGIYATAESGAILYANRAAREIAAQAVRMEEGEALPASAFPHPIRPLEGATDAQEIVFGNTELEIQRTRLPRGGMITRINNVTTRNAAAWESARLQKRLQQAAKMEAIGQLAGGIAHDFSNILSSIMGFARFLEEDLPAGSEEQSFAKRILASCERGKRLVDQILDFALTKTARQDSVDLGAVIHQCAEQLLPTLPAGIRLEVTADEGMAFVTGSAVQLSQIITNLCTNAADAIRLDLSRARQSELDSLAAGPGEAWIGEVDSRRLYARVRVSDSGEGIASQHISRIFEPFFTTKGRQRGTGLGLAVVHGAVAAHQGICHVRSEPGVGTSMSIYLPLTDSEPDRHVWPKMPTLTGTERVLLVDDEVDIVETMSRGLSRMGYRAVGTDDPTEVVRAMERDGTAWDVVITDQVMPVIGGLELIQKIKTLQPNMLAILCTGYGEASDEQSALEAGADAYVRKPVDAEALARCIRRLQADRATV
jgi:signal transduction histidine kinase/ActR/RegA family two-component response regulator